MKVKQGRISFTVEKEAFPNSSGFLVQRGEESRGKFPAGSAFFGKNDPRSFNDKEFFDFCVSEIFDFLVERGFKGLNSNQFLLNPSGKNFEKILLFLIKEIDQNFFFKKKVEDESPIILRNFFYPFVPSRNIFYGLSTPKNWPIFLGCLKWVVELIRYDSQVFERYPRPSKKKIFSEKSLWKQMTIAYHVFLSGTEEYNKYFPVLWAIIKNIIHSQKKKKRNFSFLIKFFKKKFFFVYFYILLRKTFRKKIKKSTERIFSSFFIFLNNFLEKKKIINIQENLLETYFKQKKRKKMEFSRFLISFKISGIKKKFFYFEFKNFSKSLKCLIKNFQKAIHSIKRIFFQETFNILRIFKKELTFFYRTFMLSEISQNSWRVEYFIMFCYYGFFFFFFCLKKIFYSENFFSIKEKIEHTLFFFRKHQFQKNWNLNFKFFSKIFFLKKKVEKVGKNFHCFFQSRENLIYNKLFKKRFRICNFFCFGKIVWKICFNGLKILISRELNLLIGILYKTKNWLPIKTFFFLKKRIRDENLLKNIIKNLKHSK